jgi:hypothetical protein
MRTILAQAVHGHLAAAFLLLVLGGCGGSRGLPPAADTEKARAALTTGLEAWKSGQQPDALKSQDPSIFFTDLAWEEGQRLEAYQIAAEIEPSGQSVVASAVLTLRNRQGAVVKKNVRYLIDTSPAVVIVPGDPPGKS